MAYIANTAFEARITNNSRDNLSHIAGLYQAGSPAAAADCSAGLLCVRNGRVPNEGFDNPSGTRVYNENTWFMNAAASTVTADDVIFACDTYDTQLLSGKRAGLAYFVGTETLGLGAPAGRYCNFTRINFDNESVYRFGVGNLSAALSTNTFFTIANGLLVPAAAAPTDAGSIYFELRGTGNFVEGTQQSFGYVDVVACKVTVAA
ncbi:MAG: hypothetical protein IKC04_07040 [Oscillospiraceae bacterium]|nr:hypothetical protein [Oscillospiraceae bacterium]